VEAHHGGFLLLIPNWQHHFATEALRHFKMKADWNACQIVKDRLYDGTIFELCPVMRVKE
jgi:hypothetical protein